jgi:hypothetical protein
LPPPRPPTLHPAAAAAAAKLPVPKKSAAHPHPHPHPQVGDETMSVLEIWGAEYQENDCLLIRPESRELLESICERERCLMQVGGPAGRGRGGGKGGRVGVSVARSAGFLPPAVLFAPFLGLEPLVLPLLAPRPVGLPPVPPLR